MNRSTPLLDLYGEWRRLSQEESQAIADGQWHALEKFQAAKKALQGAIIQAQAAWEHAAIPVGPSPGELRSLIGELIAMEHRNEETLARKLSAATAEQEKLDRSRRRLRRIQQSYSGPASTRWKSYG